MRHGLVDALRPVARASAMPPAVEGATEPRQRTPCPGSRREPARPDNGGREVTEAGCSWPLAWRWAPRSPRSGPGSSCGRWRDATSGATPAGEEGRVNTHAFVWMLASPPEAVPLRRGRKRVWPPDRETNERITWNRSITFCRQRSSRCPIRSPGHWPSPPSSQARRSSTSALRGGHSSPPSRSSPPP